MPSRKRQRGSVLVLAVVVVAVLALLAAAALSFSASELGATRSFRSSSELVSCAEAGRKLLISKFKRMEMPLSLTLSSELEDPESDSCPDPIPEGHHCVKGGHIGMEATAVRLVTNAMSSQRSQRDLTNIISRYALGAGQEYQVVVHCVDDRGREREVEFALRFGL
jgi:hypothetical protein